jgi:hypothetical protein
MYAYPIQSAYCRTEGKELLARLVVLKLQRRGLYRKDSTGVTRRDHLSLARSALGARRTLLDATHSSQGCTSGCSSVRHAF